MAARRPSKAEIRRRNAARLAPEPSAPTLPPEVADYVSTFRPRKVDEGVWDAIRPFVLDVLARYEPKPDALESAKHRLVALTAYVAWAHERGYPIERSHLLDVQLIEAFTTTAGLTKSTATNYRSRLRGITRKVNPAGAGTSAALSVAHRAVQPPYTATEVAAIVRIATTQPSDVVGRQLQACVGLGLGAGIDSVDLKPMRIRDIDDHGADGIRIDVPGPRPRVVWVLADFEPLVRRAVRDRRPGTLVVGRSERRKHVASDVFRSAHILGDAPTFDQARMRTTWLATLLEGTVPLPVIMQAAGLRSARTLTDLLPFIGVRSVDVATWLRGER